MNPLIGADHLRACKGRKQLNYSQRYQQLPWRMAEPRGSGIKETPTKPSREKDAADCGSVTAPCIANPSGIPWLPVSPALGNPSTLRLSEMPRAAVPLLVE